MFIMKQPFFQSDQGGDSGWGDLFQSSEETLVDEDQPAGESETEDAEGTEQEHETEVEGAETDDTEETKEVEEDGAENQAINDDSKVDMGEGRQPVTVKELKAGFLRQSDYTKKTQVLADDRKTLESERQEMSKTKEMHDFLAVNPYIRDQIDYFISEFAQTGHVSIEEVLADAGSGQYINTLIAQVEQKDRRIAELEGKYGELEFTGTLRDLKAELKNEYGNLVTDDYLKSLEERTKTEGLPLNVLREIADAHFIKQQVKSTKTAKQIEAETIQNIQEKRNALPINPRSRGQRPQTQTKSIDDMGWGDVLHG